MSKIKTVPNKPDDLKVEIINDFKARITAFPFESDYGITLAHPIRRLLLSSIVGYAPIAIKIDGVTHEFDSISGVREDVAVFIINLKKVRFKLKEGVEEKTINYAFKGPKNIQGSDLESDDVEIVTKDIHLATISEDSSLSFSLIIRKGMGYVPSEDIRELKEVEGYIVLDATFTPVKNVIYEIEKTLVKDNPNYEKVIFEITTDGQIEPLTAFKNALSIMYDQMEIFRRKLELGNNEPQEVREDFTELHILLQKLEDLNLSARSYNCLDRNQIRFVGELISMDETELRKIKNLGEKSLNEIKQKIEDLGFPYNKPVDEDLIKAFKVKMEALKNVQQ